MHTKTVAFAIAASLAFTPVLCACSGNASSSESQKTELTSAQISDAAFAAAPIDESAAFDIKIGVVKDGKAVVTFGSTYGDFSYTIDAYTGEVLEKTEPTEALEEAKKNPLDSDPIDLAMNACLNAYKTNGKETNVNVKSRTDDGVQKVRVQFDCEGKHYDLDYDVATGKITEYSAETEEAADKKENDDKKAAAVEDAKKAAAEATQNGTKKLGDEEAQDMALDACWNIYVIDGSPEDIKLEAFTDYSNGDAQKVRVQFDLNGEHYDLIYDVATGEITNH